MSLGAQLGVKESQAASALYSNESIDDPGKESKPSPAPIPNGGLVAWLQVVGAFFLFFNSW